MLDPTTEATESEHDEIIAIETADRVMAESEEPAAAQG